MVIIAALGIEIAPLLNALKADKVEAYSNKTALYRSGDTDLLVTGVGPIMAQRTLNTYLEDHSPDFMLNIGTAGMLFENMEPGKVHHISETLTENEAAITLHVLSDEKGKICLSVRRSIEDSKKRELSRDKHNAGLADMECYTLAAIAKEKNIPMSAIKVTTDFADCETADMFKKHVEESAKKLADEVINIINYRR